MGDILQLVTLPSMHTFIAVARESGMAMDAIESFVHIWVGIPNRPLIDVDGPAGRQRPGQAGVHPNAFLPRQIDRARRDVLPEIERIIADFPDRLPEWRANVEFGKAAEEKWCGGLREAHPELFEGGAA